MNGVPTSMKPRSTVGRDAAVTQKLTLGILVRFNLKPDCDRKLGFRGWFSRIAIVFSPVHGIFMRKKQLTLFAKWSIIRI
jgi:hypothetical protein